MALSAIAVTHAKPREKAYKLSDGGGLYLLVTAAGQRYWRFNYRFQGKWKTLSFGVFPDVGLAEAHQQRDAARKILALKEYPGEKRKQDTRDKKARDAETFELIGDEWLARARLQGRSEATLKKLKWLLSFAYPMIGKRPISEITALELLEVLRKIEVRGRYETAVRLRGTFETLFRYAIATGRAQRDVSCDLRGALITPNAVHRSAHS